VSDIGVNERTLSERLLLRLEVEEFLIEEAWLLDNWKLDDWVRLFTEDGKNYIPALDEPSGLPSDTVFLISDDLGKIRSRADQLLGRMAWSESPRSRVRRLIGNVRIAESRDDTVIATASFVVTRSRRDHIDTWMGHTRYKLKRSAGTFKIAERTVYVNQDSMRPQNMISIIL
jgi:p-cumate 2,3-dioxygenase beta subunit